MDFVKLVNCELDILELINLVSSPSCGATSVFIGNTRDHFNGKKVSKLVYEAYEPMAEKALLKVCGDVREKWSVHGIAIHHRLGEVPVKESSVAIAISSEHRAESLQAVQFAIDKLKAHVPIWKKEVYEGDAPAQWKENQDCPWTKVEDKEQGPSDDMVSYEEDIDDTISPDLIQIKAGGDEVKRRIESFVELKRKQVNTCNVLDFCTHLDPEYSCARVDAVLVRQKDSKGHFRVHRVENITGPQTQLPSVLRLQSQSTSTLPVVKQESCSDSKPCSHSGINPAVEERVKNAEVHLGVSQPVPKDIYARLKVLEDRILQLEGLSPEYAQFWATQPKSEHEDNVPQKPLKKKIFSAADIEKKLLDFDG